MKDKMREVLKGVMIKAIADIRTISVLNYDELTYHEAIIQALSSIMKLFLESLPEIKDEFKMTHGGCNPDRNRGFNDCLSEIKAKLGE